MTSGKAESDRDFWKAKALITLLADVMLALALVILLQVDRLVHSTLYDYGLIFDFAWAQPYWTMFRTSLALIVAAFVAISSAELVYVYFKRKKQ